MTCPSALAPGRSVRGGRGLSARFTGSRTGHRSRGRSAGPDHQRQGTPGRGRWERVGHIGPLPGRYAQSRLSPGIYRHVRHRGHSGQLRRSPGNGDEVCGGGVKVQSATLKCKNCTLEISGKIIDSFSAGLDISFGSAFLYSD